ENNVLDEFFRSGRYRVRKPSEVMQTSSPSMDISKASNFERFVFDLTERDASGVNDLWQQVANADGFDLAGTTHHARLAGYGLVSGSSSHADRVDTIQRVYREADLIIDPHTADGVKVGLEYQEPGVPLVCLETAQPAKFAGIIREALNRTPPIPTAFHDLEGRPQRVEVMAADAGTVQDFIARHGQA
ncbi:MAG: threonine synthase, partial [Betaproteobacteria bacterium]